ncbi:MAG TPA: sigma factor-like helix-turn-helix DNA-binding protein, partial [Mycobacteriales bacterium]|nr:sigma factor-like helix-turn-helix DNA-binding protein [Mycobacteriales bacterium]
LRGRKRRDRLGQVTVSDEGDSDWVERLHLRNVVSSLPRRQREVVTLRYLADVPEATVAQVLGCSVGSVKKHASRGLAALREILGDVEGNDVRAPG